MSVKYKRIEVFSELTFPNGTFDYNRCAQLLGDNYDSFVEFCEAVNLIPEEIDKMSVVDINPENNRVRFEVSLRDGKDIHFEK